MGQMAHIRKAVSRHGMGIVSPSKTIEEMLTLIDRP
jgi:hypothetical protein